MMYGRIDREEAIKRVGAESVKSVESENVSFTNRVTDGTEMTGYTEFSASVDCVEDGEDVTLVMYVYIDSDELEAREDLDRLDWDEAIRDAEYEVVS